MTPIWTGEPTICVNVIRVCNQRKCRLTVCSLLVHSKVALKAYFILCNHCSKVVSYNRWPPTLKRTLTLSLMLDVLHWLPVRHRIKYRVRSGGANLAFHPPT